MPKVSVLSPVYNTASCLERCRSAMLSQTFADWEWILVDDASTDASPSVLQSFAASDPRVKVIRFPENRGVAAAGAAALTVQFTQDSQEFEAGTTVPSCKPWQKGV